MSVTYQAAYSIDSGASTVSVLTIPTFAITGVDRCIDVIYANRTSSGRTVSSVVRGSDTYTAVDTDHAPNSQLALLVSSNEPQTSTASLAVTINSSDTNWAIACLVSDGVDQTTRQNNRVEAVVANETGTGKSVNVTSATGDLVVSAIVVDDTSVGVTGTNHTSRINDTFPSTGPAATLGMGTKPGETTAAVGYSWASGSKDVVLYGWNHPAAVAAAPSIAVPLDAGGIFVTSAEATDFGNIVVTEGANPITGVTVSCVSGKGTCSFTASGSVTLTGNGTYNVTLNNGASEAEYNTVLATGTFTGASGIREVVTMTAQVTDGTTPDSDTFDVLNDVQNLTFTVIEANYADLVTAFESLEVQLLVGQTSDTITVDAEDASALTDTQDILLLVPTGGIAGTILSFRRRRRQ